ncbi:MAG TPA: hypothetical protein VIZ90_15840 [Rhizobiaceae bacterium]
MRGAFAGVSSTLHFRWGKHRVGVNMFFVGFVTGVLVSAVMAYLFLRVSALGDTAPAGYVPPEDEFRKPGTVKRADGATKKSFIR